MNPHIDLIFNTFYQRGITTREQLLTEMLRVKMTLGIIEDNTIQKYLDDAEKLFKLMNKSCVKDLGFFPGDRDFFAKVFEMCKDIDLIEYTLELYKNDRMGVIISPQYLTRFIYKYIDEEEKNAILITEAEKHLSGLKELLLKYPRKDFTLTTSYPLMYTMLKLALGMFENVTILHQSIYRELLIHNKFDLVYCLPIFASKVDDLSEGFITDQTDGVAIENMLKVVSDNGDLICIVPARITFAAGDFVLLREHIVKNYNVDSIYILPEGIFRPYTAVKTYLFSISKHDKDFINIGTLNVNKDLLELVETKDIRREDFLGHEDWRIEMLLSDDDENIKKFKSSNLIRKKLKDIAEVFRGKSILKKDLKPGEISVLNISDIENGEINYNNLDSIDEEDRKIKRYELLDGDLVITCRGTSSKVAVFKNQQNTVIASANVIVVRPKKEILSEYIKIYFESPIGTTLIRSFQRGNSIININHSDIAEIEIPIVDMVKQKEMVKQYNDEFKLYKETVANAEKRWQNTKVKLYNQLY